MTVDEFLSRLKNKNVRQSGQGWTALCPAHNDTENSLSIALGDDGRILLKCFAGCGTQQILAAMGLDWSDLFEDGNKSQNKSSKPITVKNLAAAKGLPVRFLHELSVKQVGNAVQISYLDENSDAAPRQRLRTAIRAKDGSRWAKGSAEIVPYGIWRLDEAREAGYLVLCEGETDVWTLWHHGFPALGIPGADMTSKLALEHVENVPKLYVIHEPDRGGDTFVAAIGKRLADWKWNGQAFEVKLDGAKDPNELHKQGPENFNQAFQAALDAAKPLAPATKEAGSNNKPSSGEHLTDMGNARRLAARHGQDLRYCHPWRKWLTWDDICWQTDQTGAVEQMAKDAVRSIYLEAAGESEDVWRKRTADHAKRSESASRIRSMIALAASEPGIPVLPNELDCDPWLLNVKNGVINLKTGELRPHKRKDMLTKLAPVEYKPAAKCPRWMQFLDEIMDGNENLVNFLQRAAGLSLTGDTSENVLLILFGAGRNGKSTFLNTLLTVLGDYAMMAAPDLLLAKQGDRHPTELADLFGKRLVVAMETGEGRRLAESLIKQLTGSDWIKARRMREDFWEFEPTHKLWLATNHKPQVRGTDTAIWSRLKLIPFTVSFVGREDKKLPQKLREELPGILAWAVEGCLDWQQEGLGVPNEVVTATNAYQEEQDILAPFLVDRCIINPLAKVLVAELYKEYLDWCEDNGERPLSQRELGMRLVERGFNRRRGAKGKWNWHGIGLASDVSDVRLRENPIYNIREKNKALIPETASPYVTSVTPDLPEEDKNEINPSQTSCSIARGAILRNSRLQRRRAAGEGRR